MICHLTPSFDPFRPLGSDLCGFCLVYPLRVGYHCVLGGSMRGGPCLFLVSVCTTFCLLLLRHLGPRFSFFPSFLFSPFNSSYVDPGRSDPPSPPTSPELVPFFRSMLSASLCIHTTSTHPTPPHARTRFGQRRESMYIRTGVIINYPMGIYEDICISMPAEGWVRGEGQRYMRLKSDAAVIRLHIGQSLDSRQRSQHPRQNVCQH